MEPPNHKKPITLRSGRGTVELDDTRKSLLQAFFAIFWRRHMITATIYQHHNPEVSNSDASRISLIFNVMTQTGIGAQLKPFIMLALEKGYLEPEDYQGNLWATRAVELFPKALKAVQTDTTLEFIKEYVMTIGGIITEEDEEAIESDLSKEPDLEQPKKKPKVDSCTCFFCGLMRESDIPFSTLLTDKKFSDDPFSELIFRGLSQ